MSRRRTRTYLDEVRETVSRAAITCQTYGHPWDPEAPDTVVEKHKGQGGRIVAITEHLYCPRCRLYRRFDRQVDRHSEYVTTTGRRYNYAEAEGYRRPKRAADDDGPAWTRGNSAYLYLQVAFPELKI
jgi:hypothetical protein